jgi:hypothetical protein
MATLVAILAAILYLFQAFIFAHTTGSNLDEGTYLYKGLLFASGRYFPYQAYGPWTNHMPLSFLIPGAVQAWLVPGLRSGRYFFIFLGLLLLLGVWLVARRFGGKWWAAAAVAAIALNPLMINTYSIVVSQSLVACLLVWAMAFTLGAGRSTIQLAFGAILAGLTITTRENMLPLFPLLILYVFWQHGFRAGTWAALAGLLTIGIIHAIFWPDILGVWAGWIPSDLLDPWRIRGGGSAIWTPDISLETRIYSFAHGLRSNFIPMMGMFCFAPFIIFKKLWKSDSTWKAAFFLSVLFGGLVAGHAWASLLKNWCVFCFSGYLTFFSILGIFLIIIVNQSLHLNKSHLYTIFSILMVILSSTLVGFGSYREFGPGLLELPLPRFSGGQIQSGSAPLYSYIENLLHIEFNDARPLVSTLAGILAAVVLITVIWIAHQKLKASNDSKKNLGLFLVNSTLLLGLFLSAIPILVPESELDRCNGDIIAAYEVAGEHLDSVIPAGAKVYWEGGLSVAPMLYIPGAEIYPPQINDGYSFRSGGDADTLLRYGFWNEELQGRWLAEADFILIEEWRYKPGWKQFLESNGFQEFERTVRLNPCREETGIRVFKR